MKKFVSACLMAGLLTCAAGAAQVGTINNNYPGDTEAQAQMLYDLGLFKGTDKGFALEKSMTRAEASVMLTQMCIRDSACAPQHHPTDTHSRWYSCLSFDRSSYTPSARFRPPDVYKRQVL